MIRIEESVNLSDLEKEFNLSQDDINRIAESALKKLFTMVQREAKEAIGPFKRTGRTESSLLKHPHITQMASGVKMPVGFDNDKGGYPAIFLMYGTPRIKPDRKLWRVFNGKVFEDKIHEVVVETIFDETIGKIL